MEMHVKNLDSTKAGDDDEEDPPVDVANTVVLSVLPLQKRTWVGKVTKRGVVDNSVYFTKATCKYTFNVGSVVKCTAIQSTQIAGEGDDLQILEWRAVQMEKSNFLHYTAPNAEA